MRTILLSLAAALLIAAMAPQASATEEPVDERAFEGGNALDHLPYIAATPLHFLPREFWMTKYMLGTIEGRILLYRLWLYRATYWWALLPRGRSAPAADEPSEPELGDGPAESIMDQLEEAQAELPMVGMPGSELQSIDAMGETPTPPDESILDYIEDSPKTAVNQATPPKLVETPR